MWTHAEVYGVDEILSEDFARGRHYGAVRAVNPFLTADGVHELPPLYTETQKEKGATRRSGGRRSASRTPRASRNR